MQNFALLFDKSTLLYYEYDKITQTIVLDKNAKKEETYQEFIKITYILTQNEVEFFVDGQKNIILLVNDTFASRLRQNVLNLKSWIKNSNKKIYLLTDKKVKYATNVPMIKTLEMEADIEFNQYDCLIFTSKNAIKYLDKLTHLWKTKPAYAIGPQTAKMIKSQGGTLAFVGKEKHGDEFAQEIMESLEGKRVLYIGAEKTASNLVEILGKNNIDCDYKAVYKTICNQRKFKFPKKSIIIFSSPSIVECFFQNNSWEEDFIAISIGRTTASYFPKEIQPLISYNTSLEGCVKTALNL